MTVWVQNCCTLPASCADSLPFCPVLICVVCGVFVWGWMGGYVRKPLHVVQSSCLAWMLNKIQLWAPDRAFSLVEYLYVAWTTSHTHTTEGGA